MKAINGNGYFIRSGNAGYKALIDLLQSGYSNFFILTDSNTRVLCLPLLLKKVDLFDEANILEIPAGEPFKNIDTCTKLWRELSALGADRSSLLVNLGGGVVTDLGGFVACTFKRGIDFVNIPTTLLSMADASVGGKTGVDLDLLKNQIGIIKNPKLVVVDPYYLETLEKRQYRSGVAEMLKHGLISSYSHWQEIAKWKPGEPLTIETIRASIAIKNQVVKSDPLEQGFRKVLNFGHTLGHAIESHFLEKEERKRLLHGEAIVAGMLLEAFISKHIRKFSRESLNEITRVLLDFFDKIEFTSDDLDGILSLLKHDKKNKNGRINFVLLDAIENPVVDIEVDETLVRAGFDWYSGL